MSTATPAVPATRVSVPAASVITDDQRAAVAAAVARLGDPETTALPGDLETVTTVVPLLLAALGLKEHEAKTWKSRWEVLAIDGRANVFGRSPGWLG